ncbi:ExeA family protein [Vibrio sinaloensis]|uniref:ExeA family protein n=1 Tax=Photobacterium sp. (strain ATCC 43367) TaxID=379097 RepID=UPI00057D044E|nr:ExeA family protein [Vibrio sinaloensis]KHT38161.1 general secretion pathway protein GspA [Vibrio sinaloensis]
MYKQHFGFTELPFSIVPNSRFLFQSQRHKEAITRLNAGLGEGGGFAMLTGEVGTGKTTVARAMLRALDDNIQAGLILNPTFSNSELLEAICDEFALDYPQDASLKQLSQTIHQFLLGSYANGIQTLLVIDEAQHLSAEVLEQLRLLTNLETESQKLLKVLLIGQPELQQKLQMPQLRQLAQRITGRYHLLPLNEKETAEYIRFRLEFAGGQRELFTSKSLKLIANQTLGIPRLINLVCDAALKQAYSVGESAPSYSTVQLACQEVMSFQTSFHRPSQQVQSKPRYLHYAAAASLGVLIAGASYFYVPKLANDAIAQQVELRYPAVEPTIVSKTVFPAELASQLFESDSLEQGMATLYQVWGYQASMLDKLCLADSENAFQCLRLNGDVLALRRHNAPVLLTLNKDGRQSYAVLHSLDQVNARLLVGERNIELPLTQLKAIWSGEYRQIWRKYWGGSLKPGMQGEPVALLDHHLSMLLGKPRTGSDRYDSALQEKVKLFQRWQGLSVDGIAGKNTLQRLEEMVREGVPSLTDNEESA